MIQFPNAHDNLYTRHAHLLPSSLLLPSSAAANESISAWRELVAQVSRLSLSFCQPTVTRCQCQRRRSRLQLRPGSEKHCYCNLLAARCSSIALRRAALLSLEVHVTLSKSAETQVEIEAGSENGSPTRGRRFEMELELVHCGNTCAACCLLLPQQPYLNCF